MHFEWVGGFTLSVRDDGDAVVISGNREGLLSLSNHLRTLANGPAGSHLHLDEHNSLEEGSRELIVERADEERD